MCNRYRQQLAFSFVENEFSEAKVPLHFPEGMPNLEPRSDIAITERAAIVRAGHAGAELVIRRWSWPGPMRKPVYNFRSEGRRFDSGRCLIVADGFYEFTDAPVVEGGPKKPPRSKWLFTMAGEPMFCTPGSGAPIPKSARRSRC
jgi:putative SOS response-associated peptidase YedK